MTNQRNRRFLRLLGFFKYPRGERGTIYSLGLDFKKGSDSRTGFAPSEGWLENYVTSTWPPAPY